MILINSIRAKGEKSMEREPTTINDLPVGVVLKGLAGPEDGWPDNKENIKGARVINMDNGEKRALLDKGKTGEDEILNGNFCVANIKMQN